MSRIYLVRHGQAGTRRAYDSLSDLGHRQARLLGEYFVAEGLDFQAAYCGALHRQQKTAAEVQAAYANAGKPFPELVTDPGWNEFDLDHIYKAIAPQLAAADAEFKREYEAMVAEARAAADNHSAEVNRRWTPSDTKVLNAWMQGSHPYEGESWRGFRERVSANQTQLAAHRDANVVVFTSATPIGVLTALSMGIEDERSIRLAGVLQNASFTMIRLLDRQLRLHTFNAVPHLPPGARTYR